MMTITAARRAVRRTVRRVESECAYVFIICKDITYHFVYAVVSRPICYPPIKCCETNECGQSPTERICYSPGVTPRNPRYCSCGLANPCDCDLETRRRAAICEMSPCCRRCGRKVATTNLQISESVCDYRFLLFDRCTLRRRSALLMVLFTVLASAVIVAINL